MEIKPKEDLKKYYEKTWFIILMLFLLFPIGIYLMYKCKKFTPKVRGIIVALILIIGTVGIITEDKQKLWDRDPKQIAKQEKEQEEKIEQTKQEEDWRKNISLYGNILAKDFENFSDAVNKFDYEKMRVYSESIVEYSGKLKKVKIPLEYKNAKNKISKACDIYIETYSEMPKKCTDIEWVNSCEQKLSKANNLIREASKDFKS